MTLFEIESGIRQTVEQRSLFVLFIWIQACIPSYKPAPVTSSTNIIWNHVHVRTPVTKHTKCITIKIFSVKHKIYNSYKKLSQQSPMFVINNIETYKLRIYLFKVVGYSYHATQ